MASKRFVCLHRRKLAQGSDHAHIHAHTHTHTHTHARTYTHTLARLAPADPILGPLPGPTRLCPSVAIASTVRVVDLIFIFYARRVAKAGSAVDTAVAASAAVAAAVNVALNGAATFAASCKRTTETVSVTQTQTHTETETKTETEAGLQLKAILSLRPSQKGAALKDLNLTRIYVHTYAYVYMFSHRK